MSGPTLLHGDARALPLPDESVDLVVTSPAYFGLRDYGTDGQLGAEPTPREFIDALIACTAEMVRVLKPSGSIFVNLGDAFSKGQRFDNEFTVEDAAWLAGVVDSDGSISVRRQGTSYTAWVRVGQMRREVVDQIHSVTGIGSITEDRHGCFHWQAAAQQAAWVLRRIWPWLHIKRRPAFAAVELQERKIKVGGKGRWNALTDAELSYRERIRQAVLAWNRGDSDDYDPPLLPLPDLPTTARRIPQKSLLMLPERYRVACADELGLIVRSVIIWNKSNGLPESVVDRVRRSHEDWVHLVKSPRYYSAVDEIREPASGYERASARRDTPGGQRPRAMADACNPLGKLPGSVWTVATQPLNVPAHLDTDHYAAFPMHWPRQLISGWCPREVCTACGEGRRPVTAKGDRRAAGHGQHDLTGVTAAVDRVEVTGGQVTGGTAHSSLRTVSDVTITGYACACPDTTAPATPGVCLDPFGGTGTTALVAHMLGRRGISVDLSADYQRIARWRCSDPKERARAAGLDPDQVARVPAARPDQDALFEMDAS